MFMCRRTACLVVAFAASCLPGCVALGDVAGVTVAIASGTFTHDPAISLVLAISAKAATDEAGKTVARNAQRAEQDEIAAMGATLTSGEIGHWEVKHRLPPRSVHGEVRLIRIIDSTLAKCRELLFSVAQDGGDAPASWFITTACWNGEKWKWAAAEPAVERWGSLE